MRKYLLFAILFSGLLTACIQDAPLDPEADILTFSFPEGTLRTDSVEINNDYIVAYPKKGIDLEKYPTTDKNLTVTPGATWERIEKNPVNDTLFFIKVTAADKKHSKLYAITQVTNIPDIFDFENWVKFSATANYENPKQGSVQWYSSNNGTAIVWGSKSADEYPLRKTTDIRPGSTGRLAAELRTMDGPGQVAARNIPCVAGSLYLGGFDAKMGLIDPPRTTKFGIPFNDGRPVKLTGYYWYQEGIKDFINSDGSRSPGKQDTCTIYSTIYKTDSQVESLDGTNVSTSPNIIGRAEVPYAQFLDKNQQGKWIEFSVDFNYDSYTTPFDPEALRDNKYKITIVFSSSKRGAFYEGRPGSRLIVDDVKLHYEVLE